MLKAYAQLNLHSRRLVQLAGATLAMVILAVWAVTSSMDRQRPDFDPHPFFENLETALSSAARLDIVTKDGTITVAKTDTGWVLPDKSGFPARVDLLRQTFESLRTLSAVAIKTANPAWHKALELGDPADGGGATRITAKDGEGKVLADLFVGKEAVASGAGLAVGRGHAQKRFHVRRPGEDQTWLVAGDLSPPTDVSDWIDTGFLELTGGAVREVILRGGGAKSYVLTRASRDDSAFTLEPVPPGKKAKAGYALTGTANALVGLSIEDVRPRDQAPAGENAPTVIYRTFDGLVLTAHVTRAGEDAWLTLDASLEEKPAPKDATVAENAAEAQAAAAHGGSDPKTQAQTINAVASRFVFKIPGYKADQIVKPLDDLVEPLSGS